MPMEVATPMLLEHVELRRPTSGASGCFSEPPGELELYSEFLWPFVSTRRAPSHVRHLSWPLTRLNADEYYC
ncbi:hypothetical protein N7454_010865 [Penicillium verhagenii]|nr:hypothetical protein N7454_010865 [Penicillium verhagenii]